MAANYEWLDAKEHAKRRPDTYLGPTTVAELRAHTFERHEGVLTRRDVTIHASPALLKVSDEVIQNAIDHHRVDPTQKNIHMEFGADGVFSVRNDGRTIPIELWPGTARFVPEILFGELMSGENFDDARQRVGGGRNGLGVKLANLMSDWFEVCLVNHAEHLLLRDARACGKDELKLLSRLHDDQPAALARFADESHAVLVGGGGARFLDLADAAGGVCGADTLVLHRGKVYRNVGPLVYRQRFERNLDVTLPPQLSRPTASERADSTTVRWKVDLPRLGMSAPLSDDVLAALRMRAYDAAACTDERVAVWVGGERLTAFKNAGDYARRLGGAFVARDVQRAGPATLDVCVSLADATHPPLAVGFVNGLRCSNGTHMDVVVKQLADVLSEQTGRRLKRAVRVTPALVREHLTVVVMAVVVNPSFASQTKERLDVKPSALGVAFECAPATTRALERCGVVDRLAGVFAAQDERSVKKTLKTDRQSVGTIPKYERALKLHHRGQRPCALYVTEGDSAKALAVAGFGVIGRDYNGVFPLRGKLLNVNGLSAKDALENAEVRHLTQILGLDPHATYTPETARLLPYQTLVIFTDQDHDGSHITGLLLNWLQTFYPSLLASAPEFVKRFATPIIRARAGGETRSFFTQVEYRQWLGARAPSWVKYYKGLGTSTSEDAKTYFRDLERHLIVVRHTGDPCERAIQTFFGKGRAWTDERKAALSACDRDAFVDYTQAETSFDEFCRKELVQHGWADNARAIANVIDGFTPSRRKIMYACLRRREGEVKVAQLVGSTAELTSYHHGEQSLVQTMVAMAQTWPGTNNVALLKPNGMFGSRHMVRTEHSAARYIFTEKHPIARAVFPAADDDVLDRAEDDGQTIEPVVYAPIVPMALVNGAEGIGTGWRNFCPWFSMRDVIARVRLLVDDPSARLPPMLPSCFGFKGEVRAEDERHFVFVGRYEVVTPTTIRITELPPRTWTTVYVEWVRAHLVGEGGRRCVASIDDSSSHHHVNLLVKLKDGALDVHDRDEVLTRLALTSRMATDNMHFFDATGALRRYATIDEIFAEHAAFRRSTYAKRKAHQVARAEHDLRIARDRARFVRAIHADEIRPKTMNAGELRALLRAQGYYEHRDYEYLQQLGLFSLAADLAAKLDADARRLDDELRALQALSLEAMWHADLATLEAQLDAYEATLRAQYDVAPDEPGAKPGRKRKKST